MKSCCQCLLSITLVLTLVLLIICNKTHKSTMKSSVDGRNYKVIDYFDNPEKAAEILAYINENNQILIEYMEAKYITNELPHNKDPEWVAHYALLTNRLKKRYRPHVLTENDPPDPDNTSWTENKGEVLTMCIRYKY